MYFSAAKESAKEMMTKSKMDSDDDDSRKGNNIALIDAEFYLF